MLQCGIDPGYVLDRMKLYEIEALMEYKWMKERESWEQTRTVAYVTAQCQSTKKIDPKSILPFPWDNVNMDSGELSDEDRESIKKEMKDWDKIINKK